MCDVFCPSCNGAILTGRLVVVTIRRHPEYGASSQIKIGDVALCVGCSLVSEISASGQLIDLGSITLEDLEAPFVPGMFEPRVLMQSGSTLLWRRRDS